MTRVSVRRARPEDRPQVQALFDVAMLAFDRQDLPDRLRRGTVSVALDNDEIVGAALLAGRHIEAIAVTRSRRDEGIGRALVDAVADGGRPICAACHESVIPFYDRLGFSIYILPGDRAFCLRD